MKYFQSSEITRVLRLPIATLMSLTLLACGGGDSSPSVNTPIVLNSVTLA